VQGKLSRTSSSCFHGLRERALRTCSSVPSLIPTSCLPSFQSRTPFPGSSIQLLCGFPSHRHVLDIFFGFFLNVFSAPRKRPAKVSPDNHQVTYQLSFLCLVLGAMDALLVSRRGWFVIFCQSLLVLIYVACIITHYCNLLLSLMFSIYSERMFVCKLSSTLFCAAIENGSSPLDPRYASDHNTAQS
jgi:hypothetical protein